ncbi:MAG: radical SAM protein [Lachnospiraceae bacterium]|nr:radical SAM protein [Lachnospiraceae bacterium]
MNCNLCPRKCNIERATARGFCGEGNSMRISRAALHFWEEPCISGRNGSGAVFFTGCNLRCIYCQNAAISENGEGREVTPEELCDIFFDLKNQGAHNINLVTPSHFAGEIKEALLLAKARGFDLPFVWNSSAYESVETLRMLDGIIDVYLPDFKYMDSKMAANYSHAPDYLNVAKSAIAEMMRQIPFASFQEYVPITENSDNGSEISAEKKDAVQIMKKGVIIRHLVLPLGVKNSVSVIDYLKDAYGTGIYLSVMSQYTPLYNVPGALSEVQKKRLEHFPVLHRKITKREYEKVLQHCMDAGFENVFIQEGDVASESFIPPFGK